MRVLITNNTLADRAGSELYTRDLAIALLRRGHHPVCYSTKLGSIADDLRSATVPVVDNLERIGAPPDIIHGHHHLDTMTALACFPGVPAIYVCHGWLPWEEMPPRFPRILRYVAVDDTCYDRLISEHGIATSQVQVLLNFADLHRFVKREALPNRPKRALVFSNAATDTSYVTHIRNACDQCEITLDMIGSASGNLLAAPEQILGSYDLVFAKAKAAIEALVTGCAVIVCDSHGSGPLVTSVNVAELRRLNFGVRILQQDHSAQNLVEKMRSYSAEDANRVCEYMRAHSDINATVDSYLELYSDVKATFRHENHVQPGREMLAMSSYLRTISPATKLYEAHQRARLEQLTGQLSDSRERLVAAEANLESSRSELLLQTGEHQIERVMLQAQLNELNVQCRTECAMLQAQLSGLSSQKSEYQTECATLQTHLTAAHNELRSLREQLRSEQANHLDAQAHVSALEIKKEKIQQELLAVQASATIRARNFFFGIPGIKLIARGIAPWFRPTAKSLL